jgi:hypothetical protein
MKNAPILEKVLSPEQIREKIFKKTVRKIISSANKDGIRAIALQKEFIFENQDKITQQHSILSNKELSDAYNLAYEKLLYDLKYPLSAQRLKTRSKTQKK